MSDKKILLESLQTKSGVLSLAFEVVKNLIGIRQKSILDDAQTRKIIQLEKELSLYVQIMKKVLPDNDDTKPLYYELDSITHTDNKYSDLLTVKDENGEESLLDVTDNIVQQNQ